MFSRLGRDIEVSVKVKTHFKFPTETFAKQALYSVYEISTWPAPTSITELTPTVFAIEHTTEPRTSTCSLSIASVLGLPVFIHDENKY